MQNVKKKIYFGKIM